MLHWSLSITHTASGRAPSGGRPPREPSPSPPFMHVHVPVQAATERQKTDTLLSTATPLTHRLVHAVDGLVEGVKRGLCTAQPHEPSLRGHRKRGSRNDGQPELEQALEDDLVASDPFAFRKVHPYVCGVGFDVLRERQEGSRSGDLSSRGNKVGALW